MELTPIRSKRELNRALARMKQLILMAPEARAATLQERHMLGLLIEDYEKRTVPPLPADPVAAILFRMDQLELSPADMVAYLGTRSRVSEVLARKRPLTLAMIRRLHEGLNIPAEILIRPALPADTAREAA